MRPESARNVRKTGKTIEYGRLGERIQGTGEALSRDAELGVLVAVLMLRKTSNFPECGLQQRDGKTSFQFPLNLPGFQVLKK